jgi:hypothetical protein
MNFNNINFTNFSNLLRTNGSNGSNSGTPIPTLIYYTTSHTLYPEGYGYDSNGNVNNSSINENLYNFFNDELDNLTYNVINQGNNVQFRNDFRSVVGNYVNSVNNVNNLNSDESNGSDESNERTERTESNNSNYYNIQYEFSEAFIPASSFIERIFADYIQNKNKLNEEEYSNTTIKSNDKLEECPICFNSSDVSIKIKKCNHMFCESCIHKWLREHKNTCPICRTNVLKRTNSEIDNSENENSINNLD